MKQRQIFWTVLVLVAVCLAYANSFHNGFHFDDFHTIVDNPNIRSLGNLPRFFTDATTFSVLPANRTYRPFVSASLALAYALGHGYNPVWFHITPFALFLLQLLGMILFFSTLLHHVVPGEKSGLVAVAATAWYGLHPAMAETVNYIIQQGDIFSTFGVVAAIALYARFPKLRRTGLYLLPFAFGLLSKPPAIVLPLLLLAYILYFECSAKKPGLHAGIAVLPTVAIGIGLMWLQSALTPKTFTPSTISNADYLLTQPFVLLRYFGSFFLPLHLNVDTDLAAFGHLNASALFGLLFLACLLAVIFLTARRPRLRPVSYGLLWFLIASLPTSLYRLSEVENDHRMYMPFVGLTLAVTWTIFLLVEHLATRKPQWASLQTFAVAAFCLLMAPYAYGVRVRNQVWRTEETLWLDDVQKSPHNGRGLMNYGLTQLGKGNYQVALDYFQRALRYTPNYPVLEINLGIVNAAMNNPAAAEEHFQRAIQLGPQEDNPHYYYGRWLFQVGRIAEAVTQLRTAVLLNPDRLPARDLLMQSYSLSGDLASAQKLAADTLARVPSDSAARRFLAEPSTVTANNWIDISLARYQQRDYEGCINAAKEALKLNPRLALAYNNIGAAYAGTGKWQLAIQNEQQALAIQPDFPLAKNNLDLYQHQLAIGAKVIETPEELLNQSLLLNRAGKFQESIDAARAALKLRPDYAEAWNNIAAGYASMGQWDDAIAAAKEAVRLKPDFQLAKNNLAWALEQKRKQIAH